MGLRILCAALALLCGGLYLWNWTLRRSLNSAVEQMKTLEEQGSRSKLRLEVPNTAAEALLDQINRLLELRQADQSRWQGRERELRRQIANISHDLRTPLTSILGYLQLLEGEELPPERRAEYLAIVAGRAKTLQTLITSFYDLSRLEGGEYPLERQKVDLRPVLSQLLAAFYGDFTQAGFEVEVELPDILPPVQADPGGVLRIFTNLLRNALDHGAGPLEICLRQEGERVAAVFANAAPGLEPEDVPQVFDRFFTADKMRTGRNTGLGLAIVKTLAQQMGGDVTAQGDAARFELKIFFPCWREWDRR